MTTHRTNGLSDHIADLLPEYVNGSLAGEEQERIHLHLDSCEACRTTEQAWRAIAMAASSLRTTVNASRSPESAQTSGAASHQHGVEIMTTHANAFPIPARPVFEVPGRWQRSRRAMPFRTFFQATAAAILVVGIIAGTLLSTGRLGGDGQSGRPNLAIAPSAQSDAACTSTPLTAERVGRVMNVTPLLTGTDTRIDLGIRAEVDFTNPLTLPPGGSVDHATYGEVEKLWQEFVACSEKNDGSEFNLMTDDGLRRVIYQAMFYATSSAANSETSDKAVNSESAVSTPSADEVNKPVGTEPANIRTNKITPLTGLIVYSVVSMSDGRIAVLLVNENKPTVDAINGVVLFAQVDGTWWVDDYAVYYG